MTRVDRPIGPAVRVRRQYTGRPDRSGDARAVQRVACAVRSGNPVPLDSADALFVSRTAVVHSDRLSGLADRLAPTLRLVPGNGA